MWNLGLKLDQYRVASEEFIKDPFYKDQKMVFNENEVFYMMLLQKLKRACNYDETVIAYYYKNSDDCSKCDDQSFILTDINEDLDDELSIFSYDTDLNLTTLRLLVEYYNVTDYPCVVIEDQTYCGLQDRQYILDKICESNANSSACTNI
jgi:hypothetical protein